MYDVTTNKLKHRKLIDAVKDRPPLYENKPTFTNDLRAELWNEVSEIMDMPPDECKSKWRSHRDHFLRNLKQKDQLEKAGMMDTYRPYKFADELEFMVEVLAESRKKNKFAKKSTQSGDDSSKKRRHQPKRRRAEPIIISDQFDDGDEEYLIEYSNQKDPFKHDESSLLTAKQEFHTVDVVDVTSCSSAMIIERPEKTRVMQTRADAPTSEIDMWLNGIKETLMSLPPVYRARAKRKINDVVSESEIGYLESLEK